MKVKVTTWKVSTLHKIKDKINAQPTYQRGEVWKTRKKALLIDSMLRGIDIPKVYLRKIDKGAHEYEVADGQQRLTSIFDFLEDAYQLLDDEDKGLSLKKINNRIVGGKNYSSLPADLKSQFSGYEVSIAIIEEATSQEIRTLFGRLQEGEPLVPPEKRNAIISKIGNIIDNFAINHKFFGESKIPPERYKRQDYLSNGLALVIYKNLKPLKASLLLEMYLDKSLDCSQSIQQKIAKVLDVMSEIDKKSTTRIYKKYHFIDIFWYLYNNYNGLTNINIDLFAKHFDLLEKNRLNVKEPEELIIGDNDSKENRSLYNYYMAFKNSGAEPENIQLRNDVFADNFKNSFYPK